MSDSEGSLHIQRSAQIPIDAERSSRTCCCKCNGSVLKLVGASLCIAGAIATWVALAEKLQGLGDKYPKFYFLTYWVHSFYSVLYLVWKVWRLFPGNLSCNKVGDGKMDWSFGRIVIVSGLISIVAYISAYAWYLSLPKTPIPANTAIYQSAAAFVFIISVPLLKERVTLLKVLCVLTSIGGVTLVSFYSNVNCNSPAPSGNHTHNHTYPDVNMSYLEDHSVSRIGPHKSKCSTENSTTFGYVMLVVSVLTYALMETTYKRFATVKGDPAALCNGVRMVGYFGVHSLFWMWPPLIVLHYSGIERFEWPTWEILRLMVLNAALDVAFNGLLFVSIALSSPLFATVGTILAIPTSVIVDWLVQKYLLPWQAFIGIGLIVLGFGGFASSEFFHAWEGQKREARIKKQEDKLPLNSSAASRESSPLLGPVSYKRNWRRTIIKYLL